MTRARIGAALELARLSNAPTVLSNVLAGVALGGLANGAAHPFAPLPAIIAVMIAGVALYSGGMALNDYLDREVDARERPARPIPSGRARPGAVLAGAILLFAAALVILATISFALVIAGAGLVALIVLYDALHRRGAWTILLMGACRGMVYLLGALVHGPLDRPVIVLAPALILLAYVAGFSLIARREAATAVMQRKSFAHPSLLLIPLLFSAALFLPGPLMRSGIDARFLVATAALLATYLALASRCMGRSPPRIGAAVIRWIAAIAIYDACIVLLSQPSRAWPAALFCLGCFAATRLAQRHIAGT